MQIGLDSADVYWLRGYCHVLQALADMVLAYDHRRFFEHTAHIYFADPQTEFARERELPDQQPQQRSAFRETIVDVIAVIHLLDFKLQEPRRLRSAQEHLLQMVAMSRQSWELILAESDDDHEWIPGPDQQSIIQNGTMNQERIDTWHTFLDEAEAILQGEKLIPFWREGFEEGLNLANVFTDPRDFDLVLWVQGTAALPYLERGEQTSPTTWREFQRVFRGQFVGFAFWIN